MMSIKTTVWGRRVMGTFSLSLHATSNWSQHPKNKREKTGGGMRLSFYKESICVMLKRKV